LVDVKPTKDMLVVRNDDRPGMIGAVGTALGNDGVSITRMAVGPSREGNTALMVLATGTPASDDLLAQLRTMDGILAVARVEL
jgi:D-3-phosphoglycerate dehydrogenase